MRTARPDGFTRRDALKIAAGAALSVPALFTRAAAAPAKAADAPRLLTRDELALLDELTEMIIPADAHSPGARAARVAAYIDGRLAEAFLPAEQDVVQRWRDGLKRVDALSKQMCGALFLAATPDQRLAVLTRMAAGETAPATDEEKFFVELKAATVHGYYTSEIGIHQEMEYKGNTMLQEFAGEEPADLK